MAKRGLLKWNIPMFLSGVLIAYLYLTAVFFRGNVALALVLAGLTWWSLYRASLSHPGPVRSWAFVADSATCKYCGVRKPPRTHHCRRCDECIERYDHHCDWIDNCIGRRNYKAFVLFLVYIIGCIIHYLVEVYEFFSVVTCYKCDKRHYQANRLTVATSIFMLFYTMLVVPCAILAAIFLWRTVHNAIVNVTTFDENVKGTETYNLGCRRNLVEVFGPFTPLWALPTLVDAPLRERVEVV